MKEPQIETVNLCTVPVERAEMLSALKLPPDAKLIVNGAPVENVVVEWLQKKPSTDTPAREPDYVPPHLRVHVCETCNRSVKGSGPFASHLKFHRVNRHVRARARKK